MLLNWLQSNVCRCTSTTSTTSTNGTVLVPYSSTTDTSEFMYRYYRYWYQCTRRYVQYRYYSNSTCSTGYYSTGTSSTGTCVHSCTCTVLYSCAGLRTLSRVRTRVRTLEDWIRIPMPDTHRRVRDVCTDDSVQYRIIWRILYWYPDLYWNSVPFAEIPYYVHTTVDRKILVTR